MYYNHDIKRNRRICKMNPFAIQQRSLRSAFIALIVNIVLISSVCCKNLKTINYNNRLKNIKSILAAAVILTHCNPSNAAGYL